MQCEAIMNEDSALSEGITPFLLINPELWARIQAVDFSMVKMKLMLAEHGDPWTQERVDNVERLYRRYLYLTEIPHDHPTVPTQDIDAFWHQHILDTRAYQRDCETMFGRFLHHFPYFGLRGGDDAEQLQSAFQRTQDLYFATFGEIYIMSIADCHSPGCGSKCGDDA